MNEEEKEMEKQLLTGFKPVALLKTRPGIP